MIIKIRNFHCYYIIINCGDAGATRFSRAQIQSSFLFPPRWRSTKSLVQEKVLHNSMFILVYFNELSNFTSKLEYIFGVSEIISFVPSIPNRLPIFSLKSTAKYLNVPHKLVVKGE